MKVSTKGEFGGLGFVIQMREGNLTVVKVLPKTPAHKAGIQKDDQIKRIGEESTVNMDLNEAVSKLRGPEDTRVTITVERKSWEKPRTMTLLPFWRPVDRSAIRAMRFPSRSYRSALIISFMKRSDEM